MPTTDHTAMPDLPATRSRMHDAITTALHATAVTLTVADGADRDEADHQVADAILTALEALPVQAATPTEVAASVMLRLDPAAVVAAAAGADGAHRDQAPDVDEYDTPMDEYLASGRDGACEDFAADSAAEEPDDRLICTTCLHHFHDHAAAIVTGTTSAPDLAASRVFVLAMARVFGVAAFVRRLRGDLRVHYAGLETDVARFCSIVTADHTGVVAGVIENAGTDLSSMRLADRRQFWATLEHRTRFDMDALYGGGFPNDRARAARRVLREQFGPIRSLRSSPVADRDSQIWDLAGTSW